MTRRIASTLALCLMTATQAAAQDQDQDALIVHFRAHALAEVADPLGPEGGLGDMAEDLAGLYQITGLSPEDLAALRDMTQGLPNAPRRNQALILGVMLEMVMSGNRARAGYQITAKDLNQADQAARIILETGPESARAAAARYLDQSALARSP